MPTRAAIVLLVVLNLGAGAWWLLHAPPPPEAPPAAPPGAARLHLAEDVHAAPPVGIAGMPAPAAAPSGAAPSPAAPAQPQPQPQPAAAAPADARTAPDAPPATTRADVAATASADACEGGAGPAAGWRVYLPRLPSAEAAQATATRIGEAGFGDYLVVRDGADANTIALGRYGSEAAARRRSASLRAAGFPARCARIAPATPA